ncbi:helix-turn-helix domain-containing protein, partial [Patulibacter sp. S7RM1-6]
AALEAELDLRRGARAPVPDAPVLTRREREVLALLADGCSNREIAARLVVAEPTVKGHVGRLMRKLDAPSRLRVVARAGRLGLL